VALIKFDGKDAKVIETIPIGTWPAEIEGPHGINVSPDGKYWYLSVAHGNPYGFLYKYSTENNKVVGSTTLGLFPASLQVSKTTGLLYCVNFNLHGDMVPSSVSVVDPENMIELTRIETGVMPHGSRISPDGKFQYSVGMMSGELFEIDAVKLKVSRILDLDADMDGGMDHSMMDHSKMDHGNMQGMEKASMNTMKHSKTKPTWVIPHPIERKAYVAGNGTNDILEIDLDKWEVTGRMAGGKAPYNVDISPDGQKLVVTYKGDASTGIWDLKSGEELARVDNTRKVTHGVTISTDSKFAFVSVEGIGGEPGSVDVIDLSSNKLVSSAEVGKQAGGIIFWKMD
jgi:DNA-binding beta-propeller fold protein YncE